jgi:hypothetical protein
MVPWMETRKLIMIFLRALRERGLKRKWPESQDAL